MDRSKTLCFRCRLPVGDPPQLNTREDGTPCPTCRDRVMDHLPPLLPKEVAEEVRPHPSGEPSDAFLDDTALLPEAEAEEDRAG